MVNRAEMLALVERARAELPVELDQAAELLVAHQEVISRAEAEAEELLAQAQADAEAMIMESAMVASAQARSEQILDAARAEAARLLRECDLYTDNRLAALEEDLNRTLRQVSRGRDRLRDRSELEYLDPLPEDADPEGRDVQAEYAEAAGRRPELQAWTPPSSDEAYDQEQEEVPGAGEAVPEGDSPDTAGADLTGSPTSSGSEGSSEENPDRGRVPVGIGTGLATGPERRVIDLTAVEPAVERSGLG